LPQPVILTMDALKKGAARYEILVDNLTLLPMQDVEGIYRQMGEEFHSIQSNL